MPWQVLGTVAPTYDWQMLTTTPIDGALFKIEHDWTGTWPGDAVALLGAFYQSGKIGGIRRLWPYRDERMIQFSIPPAFVEAGFTARNLGIKQNLRGRQFADSNWTVTVSLWVDP